MNQRTKVLLIDDDEDDYVLTRDMLARLSREPFELGWASTAAVARRMLAESPPDICLLDYRLGAENGISLIPELLESGFDGPIIMLTGQRDRDLEDAALAAGAVDYLSKQDIDAYELERSLRYALMRRKAEVQERQRLESDSRRREAEAASHAKSEFLAYISHELRTPLAALLSYADLIALKASSHEIAEFTKAITRNGRYLQALLDDMLDLSLIESSKLELDIQDTVTADLIGNLAATAEVQCREKRLQFVLDLANALPARIATDKKRLTQMLFNLLGNAIKFTSSGTVTLRVDFTAASGAVDFVIEDTGPGIRERDLQSIFEPFHRLDAGNARIPGVGLGLTITQRLAGYLGASIRVSSKFGKGTQFTLSLPMSPTELELVTLSPAQLQQPDSADKRLRSIDALIAVVDDVDDIRASIAGLLEAVGATVVALESGKELISYLEDGKPAPDIVLLDMQMAGMDGYETANRLRSSGVEAPVIALTAAAFEGAREHCLAAGCDDYLSKPAEPARLYECVNGWLDHRRRGDGNSPSSRPPAQAHCDILIVDDSTDGCEAMRDLLEIAGFRVSTATDEQSASERLRSACPRAVILDLNLGDSSGIALAQHLRNNPTTSRMTILGLSGRARAELAADDSRLFDAYLQKPADLDSVLRSLADCGIEPDPDQT